MASEDGNKSMSSEASPTSDNGGGNDINLKKIPVKVQGVHIDGLQRTKSDILAQHVADVFTATDFEDMVKKAQFAKIRMEQLGLFKQATIHIDVSKGEDARPDGYEVTYNVKEPRRVAGGISTLVGTNEGSLLFSLKMPNAFGRGESVNGEYTYGTKHAVGCNVNIRKPLYGSPFTTIQTGVFQYNGEYPWSNYKELDRGVSSDLTFNSRIGTHCLRWEGVWRELACLSPTTAFAIRQEAGHSFKSSVKHILVRDRRDDRIIPHHGYCVSLTQEIAGLGGDTSFLKHEVEAQVNHELPWNNVIQFSVAGGFLRSLGANRRPRIMDRFFLGGPLTLRGFNIKGVGPHQEGSALGADTYWMAGAHLYTPLPFRPGRGGFGDLFRTHLFVTMGNLVNFDFSDAGRDSFEELIRSLRVSCGAGVVLKMGGIARLELNYCLPIKAETGDSVNHGLQFGIGLSFL